MRRVSLTDVRSVPDIQSKEHFNFVVGSTPGGSTDRGLHLKCNNVQFPGVSNEPIVVNLWGHQVKHRGKKVSSQQMQVSYFEDSSFKSTKALRAWHNAVVNSESGTSIGTKYVYAVQAKLYFYDHMGRVAYENSIVNMFPESVDGFEMSGDASAPLLIQVTFAYDYVTEGDALMGAAQSLGVSLASDFLGVDIAQIGLSFPDALRNLESQAIGTAIDMGIGTVGQVASQTSATFGGVLGSMFS